MHRISVSGRLYLLSSVFVIQLSKDSREHGAIEAMIADILGRTTIMSCNYTRACSLSMHKAWLTSKEYFRAFADMVSRLSVKSRMGPADGRC